MLKKMQTKFNNHGFTLIELLAVIVILAILAAIAIPSVMSIISKQNDKATAQNALNAIHAAKLYVADNNVTSTTTLYTGSTSVPTNETSMASYIDKAGGVSGDFEVTVTFSGGNATYAVKSNTALSSVTGLTASSGVYPEQTLINFSKGD